MRGIKEILLSFTIGLAGFATLTWITKTNDEAKIERRQEQSPPTNLAGKNEDPALALSWGLEQIEAPKAWKKENGNKRIVIAIIDTGADVHHPALKQNIWRNPGESGLDEDGISKAMNGLDDDGNGFVDDVHGWNFTNGSPDVTDDHGHGTHIAGIVGGQGTGVARDVSLMILKYYDTESQGYDNLTNTVSAIRYAIRMGANVINYSGGGMIKSADEENMLQWAAQQGILVVAAAGNEASDSDILPFFPASYELNNIISVGATDRHGHLLSISNHGTKSVDLAAPGKNIYSTLPNGEYGYMTGTSQATAFVSGVAALLLAHAPHLSANPPLLIDHMVVSGRSLAALKTKTRSGRLVDANQALSRSDTELASLPQRRTPARN